MTVQVAHVFYDVFMGNSHKGLKSMLSKAIQKTDLPRDEVAIFINRSFTGVKVLAQGRVLIYHKPEGGFISVEAIKALPMKFGGPRLVFTKNLEANLIAAFNEYLGEEDDEKKAKRA